MTLQEVILSCKGLSSCKSIYSTIMMIVSMMRTNILMMIMNLAKIGPPLENLQSLQAWMVTKINMARKTPRMTIMMMRITRATQWKMRTSTTRKKMTVARQTL